MKKVISLCLTVALAVSLFAGCSCGKSDEIDKEAGYKVDKYITLGKYKGFDYDIDQKKFDEELAFNTYDAQGVKRAAKKGDEIEFSTTGYIAGKKVDDLSRKNVEVSTSKKNNALMTKISEALYGKKEGETATVKASGKDASALSEKKKKYTQDVVFKVKIDEVREVHYPKVTDQWVKDETDYKNTKEFFNAIEEELETTAVPDLWQKAIDNAKMTSWPPKLYDKVKEEAEEDAAYNADEWDMSLDEYYKMNGDTKESLEKDYLNQVKSTLVMWAIVKEEDIKVTKKDIEDRYKEMLEDDLADDDDYKTVADVKKDYSESEIKEAVYLNKAQQFVCDHSNVTKTYKVHNNK